VATEAEIMTTSLPNKILKRIVTMSKLLLKRVTPYTAFCNGKKMTVEQINITSIFDNLVDHVKFRCTLYDKNSVFAGEGVFELKGSKDYDEWDATVDNAYEIVCNGIGLTLLQTGGVTNPEA